jgi:5-(carboxyamino)imidazole ribonucleotide mutase
MPLVAVVMGSKSDSEAIKATQEVLESLGVSYDTHVISAHRTPEEARQFALKAEERGIEVIIAAAGGAAHLPGVLASWTTLPVIGVQMPAGIPVATVAVGIAGARNAAYLAAEILGLKYNGIRNAYKKYRSSLQGEP